MANARIDKQIRKVMRELGKRGGKARARNHSKEQLSAWAKKGGRPRKQTPALDSKQNSISQ